MESDLFSDAAEESKSKRGRVPAGASGSDGGTADFGALLQQVLAGNQRIEGKVGDIDTKVDAVAVRVDRVETRQAGLESRIKSLEQKCQASNASTSARSGHSGSASSAGPSISIRGMATAPRSPPVVPAVATGPPRSYDNVVKFRGFAPNSKKDEIASHVNDVIRPLLGDAVLDLEGSPFGPGARRESIYWKVKGNDREAMWGVIKVVKAMAERGEGFFRGRKITACPRSSPEETRLRIATTRGIKAAKKLWPDHSPDVCFTFGKIFLGNREVAAARSVGDGYELVWDLDMLAEQIGRRPTLAEIEQKLIDGDNEYAAWRRQQV